MKYFFILLTIGFLTSCNWFKQKAKDTVNKSGEIVAKTGSELVDGVSKGVEKTFQNTVIFSGELQKDGLKAGKFIINSTDSSIDNILTGYLIFDSNMERNITVKVFNENGQEYGRVSQHVQGQKGEAKYIDFVFDKRTNIDGKGKVSFE
ncbi:MAG TPA: hypothetical protein VFV68_15485 [Agriterribacter sp.]|nr:hypothetical protein [Agriterribacter sp.]